MGTRYYLTITSLLASTRGVHQEIVFESQLPPQKVSQEACLVQLRVRDGVILSCEFKEVTGHPLLFQHEQVIDILASLGMLEWYRPSFAEHRREGIHEPLPSGQNASRPRLTDERKPIRQNSNADLKTVGHIHRRVFSLVDGTREVQHIAKLLSKDTEEIIASLEELQTKGLIIFQTPS